MKALLSVLLVFVTCVALSGCASIQPMARSGSVGICYDSNPCAGEPASTEEVEKPMSFREKAAWTIVTAVGGYFLYDLYQDSNDNDKKSSQPTNVGGNNQTANITGDGNTVIFDGGNELAGE